ARATALARLRGARALRARLVVARLQREGAAAEELAAALLGFGDPLVVVDDELAAREDVRGARGGLAALEGRVVDAHVERVLAEELFAPWIPDDDVGVGADGEGAFLAVEAEDLGGRGRGDLDEAVERDLVRGHAFPEEVEAGLDARHAVGDLGEVVAAELL